MLTRMTGGLALAAVASVLPTGAAYADDVPRSAGPAPLIGNVTVFNDEIVEPVSLPLSTCGGLLQVLSEAPNDCEGASRVSDDDA